MADSEPVEVAVEIIDEFSDDLKELETKLEKIDGKKLEVSLDVDDDGSIENIKGQLKSLEKKLDATLDIDLSGHISAEAMKKKLGQDMYSTLHVRKNPMGHLGGGDSTGFDPPSMQGFSPSERKAANWIINDDVAAAMGKPPSHRGRVPGAFGAGQKHGRPDSYPRMDSFSTPFSPDKDKNQNFGFDFDLDINKKIAGLTGKNGSGEGESAFGNLARKLAKLRPNIMMVWNFLALLIPVLVTLAGAALGAAAAFGGLAVAGASIMGLGLLGYGENAADSMEQLKAKIQEVKGELFSSLRPAMKAMNPIADQFLDGLGPAAAKLAPALERMADFEGFFSGMGSGLVDWAVEALNTIADLRSEIEAVAGVLGSKLGDLIINLLSWATEEVHDNMGAFMALGSILASLVSIIYNVSKVIAVALAPFSGLFKSVAGLAGLLNNKYVSAVLSAVAAILILSGAIYGLNIAMNALTLSAMKQAAAMVYVLAEEIVFLAASMIRTAATGVASMISSMYAFVAAANSARAAVARLLAMTGLGAVLAIGGYLAGEAIVSTMGNTRTASDMSGGGSGFNGYDSRGGGGGSTINIYGDVGNTEYQKMKDNFGSMYSEQATIEDETEK